MQLYKVKVQRIREEKKETEQAAAEQTAFDDERGEGRSAIERERNKRREQEEEIRFQTSSINENLHDEEYIFFANNRASYQHIGVATESMERAKKLTELYLSCFEEKFEIQEYTEITAEEFIKMLNSASRYSMIDDTDEVCTRLGLDNLENLGRLGIRFSENIIELSTRKKNEETISRMMMGDTFLPEFDRIYTENRKKQLQGHPVHYMFCTDDRDVRRESYRVLLSALYENGRLKNRRYVFADVNPQIGARASRFSNIYKVNEGGAVVLRYECEDAEEDDDYAGAEQIALENLCEVINEYRHKTLTILCFPRECKQMKEQVAKYLQRVAFVELEEDLADSARATEYLKMLCKEKEVRADKELLSNITEGEKYLPAELKSMVELWYDKKLKASCYPQYRCVAGGKEKIVANQPKGSAYDELMSMIGLDSAKTVIKNALDYFKAQKVFADQGMRADQPSLHCVFTGAPGTAKTSVARLFARILRENGILSKGHLVEVGRSDLVGRFVGWTAQTVKEKFKMAEGGILFIDEAYSLVDDRSGSFGDEAINTIVQEMENRRKNMMVIFAGYSDRMKEFLQKNPGLSSRIAFHVPFEDYSREELLEITNYIAEQKGLRLTVGAKKRLGEIYEEARKNEDFGNGRYVRNVLEQAKMAQASRLLKMDLNKVTREDVATICEEDIRITQTEKEPERRAIGFY